MLSKFQTLNMNIGSFDLNRTGYRGLGRENNDNSARNYFVQYSKSDYVKLMSEEEDADLETWVAETPSAKDALCDIEVIQQFALWLCHFAKKSEKQYHGEHLGLRSIQDMLSSI